MCKTWLPLWNEHIHCRTVFKAFDVVLAGGLWLLTDVPSFRQVFCMVTGQPNSYQWAPIMLVIIISSSFQSIMHTITQTRSVGNKRAKPLQQSQAARNTLTRSQLTWPQSRDTKWKPAETNQKLTMVTAWFKNKAVVALPWLSRSANPQDLQPWLRHPWNRQPAGLSCRISSGAVVVDIIRYPVRVQRGAMK